MSGHISNGGTEPWHEIVDSPYHYDAKVDDLNVIYLKTDQYEDLVKAKKLVPNALYLTPDDNDSSGGFLSRTDIENKYTTSTDFIPSSRLVWLLMKRVQALEAYLGLAAVSGTGVIPSAGGDIEPGSKYVMSADYVAAEDPSVDPPWKLPDELSQLLGKTIVKTETP